MPVVRVVGLGPGAVGDLTQRTIELLNNAPVARLRTSRHPSASAFEGIASYDDWYETASSFDDLYATIVDDLVALATSSPNEEVVYAVPGSPVVAERTVEMLRERGDVQVVSEAAVSVIDVVCNALGQDPMSVGLRIEDALGTTVDFRGPGPLLILQTYSPEILASVADRLPQDTLVTVVHHVGLPDQVLEEMRASELPTFDAADHLTSLWVESFRDGGEAMADLIDFMKRLRAECPWDQEQTHASLTRHLLEESYETIDALETFVREGGPENASDELVAHVEEELGDLLFQIVFHAELGDEEGNFNFASIADGVRDKLIGRHPHVFGDLEVADSNEVAANWENLKRDEKGRTSVTDGIAWQLPAMTLYTKLLRKAMLVDIDVASGDEARARALKALSSLQFETSAANDAESTSDVESAWGDVIASLVSAARFAGVDLEGVLRERAISLRDDIRSREAT